MASKDLRRKNNLQKKRSNQIVSNIPNFTEPATIQPANRRVAMQASYSEYSAGPLPSTTSFAGYEETLKGAANRILTMAEKQSAHRQDIERKAVYSGSFRATLGVICAAVLCIAFLIGGLYAIIKDHDWVGTTIIVSALGGLVATFIYGTQSQRQERKEKKESSDKLIKPPVSPPTTT